MENEDRQSNSWLTSRSQEVRTQMACVQRNFCSYSTGCTGLVEFPRDALRIVSSPIPPCGRCHPRPWEGPRKGLLWPLDVPQHNEDSKGSRLKTQLGKQDTDQIYSDAAEEETISLILEDKSIICREEMVPVNPCDSPDTRR
nr:uncharacterized protein LOC102089086 isoform X4 [Columba livia]